MQNNEISHDKLENITKIIDQPQQSNHDNLQLIKTLPPMDIRSEIF